LEYEMLSKIVKRLQERFRVHAVILFGSRARGVLSLGVTMTS